MTADFYLRPTAITAPAPDAIPLAGGPFAFAAGEVILRAADGGITREALAVPALDAWAAGQGQPHRAALEHWRAALTAPRARFAGLDLSAPRVMGVINVTPDSFSDGGDHFDHGEAVASGLAMQAAGAAILDVGGESTRPGAEPVPEDEELRRVIPTVRGLAEAGALVSIDTRRARVMAAAVEAGARIINDVTALRGDPESLGVAAESGLPVILMHMQGEPRTMQAKPTYADAALDIFDWLAARVDACVAAGIARARIAVDPGIGFGKTVAHNLQLLEQLALFHGLGCPLVLGVSRKGFIGTLSGAEAPKARMPGSLAAALAGLARGAQIVRVHDVEATVQAITVWQAIAQAGPAALAANA